MLESQNQLAGVNLRLLARLGSTISFRPNRAFSRSAAFWALIKARSAMAENAVCT
jgi:hypothetical protein